jgi:hypothetical protein
VAIPPDSEVAEEPAPGGAERLSYLDAGGRLASRETAQFAVVRDFDDHGNVISLMTERLARGRIDSCEPGGGHHGRPPLASRMRTHRPPDAPQGGPPPCSSTASDC